MITYVLNNNLSVVNEPGLERVTRGSQGAKANWVELGVPGGGVVNQFNTYFP
jgi:hypothetical protein